MKNLCYLLVFLITSMQAQIVNIPDANFKQILVSANYDNQIASANEGGAYMTIDSNNDGEIQMGEALMVRGLNLEGYGISNLTGIEYFTNLINLSCKNNNLTQLDLSTLNHLSGLSCSYNQLTSLVLPPWIWYLYCDNNQLVSLDLTNSPHVINFDCSNNVLTSLTFAPDNYYLMHIFCDNNQLTTLNTDELHKLYTVRCRNNAITSLDFQYNPFFWALLCNDNNLNFINLKNGTNMIDESISNAFYNNPNLRSICVDDTEQDFIQDLLTQSEMLNVSVSSYCSFSPGGSYNTIAGSVRFDTNEDGCSLSDPVLQNMKIDITDGVSSGAAFTSLNGIYTFYVQQPNLTLTPVFENSLYFTVDPIDATIDFLSNNFSTQLQDFCVKPIGFHPDIEVIISPLTNARPGFNASYQITYKNKGNYAYSEGIVGFQFDDTVLDFVSASEIPFTQAAGQINWNFTNLMPFESRSIEVTLNLNGPIEIPAVNIDDILNFTVSSFPSEVDETPLDNSFTFQQTVVGSFDPNDKTCLEGNVISTEMIGNYLHYNINFENTGTAAAEKIVVKDIIDTTKFDISTLQVLNISHAAITKVSGNKVEFMFDNINLLPAAHGNIVFKLKTKSDLAIGSTVSNKADIYFDYNFPIETNTATSTFQLLNNTAFEIDDSITVYPNPAKNQITVNAKNTINSMQLFDVQGRIINTSLVNDRKLDFDISSYSNGIYFLKVTTDKGIKTQKIIKD
ncbi:MAG: T9SS type A sorting domain-containing protein [Flavobacterium sp.]|nr:T9SS type A sorting domain-containing protein [Flavobacterium sp.]